MVSKLNIAGEGMVPYTLAIAPAAGGAVYVASAGFVTNASSDSLEGLAEDAAVVAAIARRSRGSSFTGDGAGCGVT
jgi:elongation factor P hydroxylase